MAFTMEPEYNFSGGIRGKFADSNYMHEYTPRNKDGHCKRLVGGRKSGFKHCGQAEDAVQHVRYQQELNRHESEMRVDRWRLINER